MLTSLLRSAARAGVLALAFAAPLGAQTNIQPFGNFDFDLNPPGARAAALGGVFVPLADDATAAESNPAGLANLLRPEISFEYKAVELEREIPESSGGGPGGASFIDHVGSPAFASAVLPLGRFSISGFRAEIVNMKSTNFGRGLGELDSLGRSRPVVSPFTNEISVRIVDYGVAIGFRALPSLSIGASAGLAQLDLELDHGRYLVQRFEPAFQFGSLLVSGDDGKKSALFYNVGLLLRAGDNVTLGAVYNARPRFEDVGLHNPNTDTTHFFSYNVPDSYTGGFAVRFSDQFTLAGEAAYILYSQLQSDFQDFFGAEDDRAADDFRSLDGIDLRAGAEYVVFLGNAPVGLRAGVASLAPSNIFFTGTREGTRADFGTGPEDRRTVYTLGFGLAQLFDRFNLDFAARISDERRELSSSIVYRFE